MARSAFIALLLAGAALALSACGGNDDSSGSASDTSTTSGLIAPQGTTSPREGATGSPGSKAADRKRTGKSNQRSDGKAGAAVPTPPAGQAQPQNQRSLTPAELKVVGRELGKQARVLCKASTLDGLAQQYGIKNADPDEVAKAFAATYLVGLRDAVAAGCKKGLLESK